MKLASWKLLTKALWNEKNSPFGRFSADFLLLPRSFKTLIPIAAAAAYTSSSMAVASEHRASHLSSLALSSSYPPAPARSNHRSRR